MTLNFLEAVLHKEQRLSMEVENLSTKTALQKIGCFFLRLCNLNIGNSVTIRLPYDKFLLAARIGMRAETFSRSLIKLAKQCDIKINDNTVAINNMEKLSHFVCQHCSKTFPCKSL